MITDYNEVFKKLIVESYVPGDIINFDFEFSTLEILEKLSGLLSLTSLDADDVFTCLTDLGYTPQSVGPLTFKWFFKNK